MLQPLLVKSVAHCLGVKPQRGQRCPQPVSEVGGGEPGTGEQGVDPVGEFVDGLADLGHFIRPGRHAAAVEVAVAQPVGHGHQRQKWPDDAGAKAVCQRDSDHDQQRPAAKQQQPGPGHPPGELIGGHPDHDRPGGTVPAGPRWPRCAVMLSPRVA